MSAHRKSNTRWSPEDLREAVRRQHHAGLSDWRIATVLHVDCKTVKRVREALGLAPNKAGTP